ncbi:N-acetylmuramoyl-L-alanine amidase [Candidatus Omnitrophota bacterium]
MTKYTKILIPYLLIFLCAGGCVTTPKLETTSFIGPTYSIGRLQYVPLSSVIDTYGLSKEWDSVSKKVTLSRADKKVVICVGSDIALVNGTLRELSGRVTMHRGVIVLPRDFSARTLNRVFVKNQRIVETPQKRVVIPTCVYSIKNIVVDPGHGGKDPGAMGYYGLREKDITLDIAKRLKRHLEAYDIDITLTRDSDRFISLWKRADIANKKRADFFISIHANASRSRKARGFEVYYLSEAIDDNARAVAAAENASLKYEDSSFGNKKPSTALEATLWDIENSENRIEARELGEHIAESAHKRLRAKNRGVKTARFYVLKGSKVPSVLVETGFVSNKYDAKKLSSPEYRESLAKAIALGVIDYKDKYEKSEGFTR